MRHRETWSIGPDSNRRKADLQSAASPLGYRYSWSGLRDSNALLMAGSHGHSLYTKAALERARRFELPSLGWRPKALPLDDTRSSKWRPRGELNSHTRHRQCRTLPLGYVVVAPAQGNDPQSDGSEPSVLPLNEAGLAAQARV